ncbi:MAG: triose-phosphate isomerase [Syntrophomonadaceae bacterium]|jgi:triosephosphate isomerase|nr:triose-phosphate isomerase [Syntrophomonadaceae bacterium]
MRRPLIAGNWKMHKNIREASEYIRELNELPWDDSVEVAVIPPFTCLFAFREARSRSRIRYGAQNMFWAREGAFTGEISPLMLLDLGCEYVLIGHSERRQIMGESDRMINDKLRLALETGLFPILCVGETLEERENGNAKEVVGEQVRQGLQGVIPHPGVVIAYEPVWAIGTGVNATASDAQEMIHFVRDIAKKEWGSQVSDQLRILYGGSVKPANIGEFMSQDDIDGALVGGASLDPKVFADIINFRST